jgi:hypothetical protein
MSKVEFRDIRREFFEKAFAYSSDKAIATAYLEGMFDAFNIISECIDITYTKETRETPSEIMKCDIRDSSVISAVEYNPNLKAMKIRFTSGSVYLYPDMTEAVYVDLVTSEYKGKYFNKYIKPFHKGIRLDEAEEN